MFLDNFYDKYGNFDNRKFVKLLEKTRHDQLRYSDKSGDVSLNKEINIFNSASKKEIWQLINRLSIFINSGIDIKGALNILVKQLKNPYLKRITTEIKENINHGISINETMTNYPKIFDNLTVAMIKVGEKTGKLGSILSELDHNLLESIELRGKVKGAMIYPAILLSLTLIMVTFMMIFIVPKITESFNKTGTDLPALTQFIVNISNFFIDDWLKLIILLILLAITIKVINLSYHGRMFFSRMFIRLPVFGYIVMQSNIVYFIKSFTILLDSGVLLLESIKTASQVVTNLAYKKELIRIKNEVEVGLTMSKSLGLNTDYEYSIYLNKLFSEEFAYIVSTGEETGSLSDSLKNIGRNYNSDLKRYIDNLSSTLEPIIIVIVGFLVGTIVISIMLPFFELGNVAKSL